MELLFPALKLEGSKIKGMWVRLLYVYDDLFANTRYCLDILAPILPNPFSYRIDIFSLIAQDKALKFLFRDG